MIKNNFMPLNKALTNLDKSILKATWEETPKFYRDEFIKVSRLTHELLKIVMAAVETSKDEAFYILRRLVEILECADEVALLFDTNYKEFKYIKDINIYTSAAWNQIKTVVKGWENEKN